MVDIKREDLEAVVSQLEDAAKLASSAAEVCSSVADSYKQNETSLEMAAGWLRGGWLSAWPADWLSGWLTSSLVVWLAVCFGPMA